MSDEKKSLLPKDQPKNWWFPEVKKLNPKTFERRMRVATMWNQSGYTVQETAEALGVSVNTIRNDRRWLLDAWQTSVLADMNDVVGRELSKLEKQESELWLVWQASKEDETIVGDEITMDSDGAVIESVRRTQKKNRSPDPKYMDLILKIQERRARLLGLDKQVASNATTFNFAMFVEEAYRQHMQARVIDVESGGEDGNSDS